jgi:hypothetical protein
LTFDLQALIRRGHELYDALVHGSDGSTEAAIRLWQRDCAATVSQLSGGSKAHWLAREFSQAFLVRSAAGDVVEQATLAVIVQRLLAVLEQAHSVIASRGGRLALGGGLAESPQVRRFEFVHDAQLRPILEQAYVDSRKALAEGQFGLALVTSCSILESILTDALVHANRTENVGEWSFEARIAAAEQHGLIRGACSRLPAVARAYRESANADRTVGRNVSVSEHDARRASQVLQVVMRDLEPGRG